MTIWLKQSTAAEIGFGPFVDATDGVTAETGLTISQADIRLKKNDGAFAQTNNSAGATHLENGYYEVPLDTTDTNTLGRLRVAVNESGALPVWQDFMIVPANVWDSMFGADLLQVDSTQLLGTAYATPTVAGVQEVDITHFGGTAGTFASGVPAVNATQVSGDSTAADNLEQAFDDAAGSAHWTGVVDQGTAQSIPDTTHTQLRAAAAFGDDTLVGATLYIVSATTGAGQRALITDYVGSTDTAAHDAFPVALTGTVVYKVFASAPGSTGSPAPVDLQTIKGQTVTAAAGVTFPTAIASPTNITAGTITTVTNLTNAPTAGDFTATMKTSIGTAVAASAVASVTGNVGGNVVGSVGSVAGAVGSVTGNVGGNVTGSVGSLAAQAKADVNAEVDTALADSGINPTDGVGKIAGVDLQQGGTGGQLVGA